MCYSFFHRREWKNNTFSDSLSAVYAAACIRVYAYINHVSISLKKAQPEIGCASLYFKCLYLDNDGQNHRPSLRLAIYEFPDMIFQGLLDQIPLGGPGFR